MTTTMLQRVLIAILALAWLAPSAATAACNATGNVGAKSIPYNGADATTTDALAAIVDWGFRRSAAIYIKWLRSDNPNCREASITVGSLRYTFLADDRKVWPRAAQSADGPSAYLIGTLRPETYAKARRVLHVSMAAGGLSILKLRPSDMIYVLAVNDGSLRTWSIFGFYDGIPDTPRLAQVMCQAALGSLPVAATYDMQTQVLTVKNAAAFVTFGDVGKSGGPCTVGPPA